MSAEPKKTKKSVSFDEIVTYYHTYPNTKTTDCDADDFYDRKIIFLWDEYKDHHTFCFSSDEKIDLKESNFSALKKTDSLSCDLSSLVIDQNKDELDELEAEDGNFF